MNKLRAWLLIKLAGKASVVLNTTVNIYQDAQASDMVGVVYRGKEYAIEEPGKPILEIKTGSLVVGCTFRTVPGQADRILNG